MMSVDPEREEAIFQAARLLDVESERDGFLAQACKGDPDLRKAVEELLRGFDASSRLEQTVATPDGMMAETVLDAGATGEMPGDVIGQYELLQKIGEGGFGVVWMAEQKVPMARRVALKVLKAGMASAEVIARFEVERAALALMDHSNIARVFDAGQTGSGSPYFVMELVKGVPITDYCDQNNLDTKKRLALFTQICRAMQHAHQKGIIHRDLKPSNIMVTLLDGTPVPKVIDFGIAKAMDRRLTEMPLFTRYEQMIGTPAYMSPEQAEMSGLDIDTRSDIYSLGVLLYELLTGTTPFDAATLQMAAFDEIRRIIREEEPPKPSTRIETRGVDATEAAHHRAAEPPTLSRLLRGDLDWIVMKALEKDRTRRYESASDFALDIERHLRSEPVSAAAPSLAYKIAKFTRRNRGAVIAGCGIATALVLGLAGSIWQAVVATSERERATVEKQRAELAGRDARDNRRRAEEIVSFMLKDFADQLDQAGRLDLLDAAVERAGEYFDEAGYDPTEPAELLARGRYEYSAGYILELQDQLKEAAERYLTAIKIFQDANAQAERLGQDGSTDVRIQGQFGLLEALRSMARTETSRGRSKEAEQYQDMEEALVQQLETDGDLASDPVLLGRSWHLHGRREFDDDKFDVAEKTLRKALALLTDAGGDGREVRYETARCLTALASCLASLGRAERDKKKQEVFYREAIDRCLKAIKIYDELRESSPDSSVLQGQLALVYKELASRHLDLEDFDAAQSARGRARALVEPLVDQEMMLSGWRVTLSSIYGAEAYDRHRLKDSNSALELVRVAITTLTGDRELTGGRLDTLKELAQLRYNEALYSKETGHLQEAKEALSKSQKVLLELLALQGEGVRIPASSFSTLESVCRMEIRFALAAGDYREVLASASRWYRHTGQREGLLAMAESVLALGRGGKISLEDGRLICLALMSHDPEPSGVAIGEEEYRLIGSQILSPIRGTWRFAVEPEEGWRELDYDDSDWELGPAPLGFGDPALSTDIKPEKRLTTLYFRRRVECPQAWEDAYHRGRLRRDDGAIVYLNGKELLRDNLPPGEITPATLAVEAVDLQEESTLHPFDIAPGLLVAGENVIAVEVYQQNPKSSDIIFDLELSASRESPLSAVEFVQLVENLDWEKVADICRSLELPVLKKPIETEGTSNEK